jgi:glycosyltransferase involved in cell wall biosynthesis
VALPTYRNNGSTIAGLLKSLESQTYRDFTVLILYKPSEGDRTLEVVEEFQRRIDLQVKFQERGHFEEALNAIYSTSSADILITTDDDALPSRTWVEDHVKVHEEFSDAGVVAGKVVSSSRKTGTERIGGGLGARVYQRLLEPPIEEGMRDFQEYIAVSGLLVKNGLGRKGLSANLIFNPIGVNMSVKREVYGGFQLIPMTLRGIGNEPQLCLHAYRRGMPCVRPTGKSPEVSHLERDSLSRPRDARGIRERFAELALLPYVVSRHYEIDLLRLELDVRLRLMLWRWRAKTWVELEKIRGMREGLRITSRAIRERRDPQWIRERLGEV